MESFNNTLSADVLIERKRGKVRLEEVFYNCKGPNCESTEPTN